MVQSPLVLKYIPAKARQGNSRKTLGPGLGLRSGIPCGDGSHHLRWMGRLPFVFSSSSSSCDDDEKLFPLLFLVPRNRTQSKYNFPVIDFASCGPPPCEMSEGSPAHGRPFTQCTILGSFAPQDQTACRAQRTSRQRTRSSAVLVLVLGESAPLRARTWLWCERRQK